MSIKPVSDLYLITYEDGSPYKSTRDAKEAVDAIGAGFKVEEFVSLENHRAAMLQAEPVTTANKLGNSPVIPDGMLKIGYIFITAEGGTAFSISDVPVPGMTLAGPVYAPAVKAGGQQNAPQNIPKIIPGWIPVSERMPIEFEAVIAFDGDQVYGEAMYSSDDGFTIDGYEPCDRLNLQNVTHWMPLPAAPEEVKSES